MANLGKKGDLYVARFRFRGKEYKKSLKTARPADARVAMLSIEQAIHRLTTGLIEVPAGVDPGDFIVSGGTLREPAAPRRRARRLSELVPEYLANLGHKAGSTAYTEGVHLRNLISGLGRKAESPIDGIAHRDLEAYIQARLRTRSPVTVDKERVTIGQFFAWAVRQGELVASPAVGLTRPKEDAEPDRFRTAEEIEAILARGGLGPDEVARLWDGLYLTEPEIIGLLADVRARSGPGLAFLLHAVPAHTGMRCGELLRLRWADVDLEGLAITARSRKQSRQRREVARTIELHPALAEVLREWRSGRPRGQYVVGDDGGAGPLAGDVANRHFWRPMRGTRWCLDGRRNWFKVGFHTYRHSFASNLAARGVDPRLIDAAMGHQTEEMRRRYQHLTPGDRRAAVRSLFSTPAPGGCS